MTRHAINPANPYLDPTTAHDLEAALFDRRQAEAELDDSLTGILIEPLSAIAGGILGGALIATVGWRLAWSRAERTATHTTRRQLRRLRRNLAGRP